MNLFKKTLVAASFAALAPISAFGAVTWTYDWAAADAATGVANVRPLSNPTNELKFTAESVVRFNDLDSSGGISTGDTFTDYIVVRIDQLFFNGSNNGETGLGYQTSREITLTAQLTGVQTGLTSYTVDSGGILNFLYDSGIGFTSGNFANLATFTDGRVAGAALLAETGTVVPPSGGVNNGSLPDGTIDIFMTLQDQLATGDFEVNSTGGAFLNINLGIADGNNAACADSGGFATCFATTGGILGVFGAGALGANQFEFHTRTDGSMIKQAIPEPSGLALAGIALLGLAAVGRRRRS